MNTAPVDFAATSLDDTVPSLESTEITQVDLKRLKRNLFCNMATLFLRGKFDTDEWYAAQRLYGIAIKELDNFYK